MDFGIYHNLNKAKGHEEAFIHDTKNKKNITKKSKFSETEN